MHPRSWRISREFLFKAALVLGAVLFTFGASVIAPRFLPLVGPAIVPAILVALLGIGFLMVVPVATLPVIALVIYCLVPAKILPSEGPLGALPATTILLVVWVMRRILLDNKPLQRLTRKARADAGDGPAPAPWRAAAVISAVAFLLWAIFALVRSVEVQTSAGWLISFTCGALLPLLIANASKEAEYLRKTWIVLGAVLGVYAVVEAALRANPLWGTLYSAIGAEDSQHWSVYRAEVGFGHPLIASLFFAAAACLALGNWLTTNAKWTLLAAALSAFGLAATVSRGAILAGGIALVFCALAALFFHGEKRWNRFALVGFLGVVGLIGLSQFGALTDRNDSAEAVLSAGARDTGIWVAQQAAALTNYIGSGPGTSGITGRLFDDVVIENSGLQLLISVGIPGLLFFLGIIGSAFFHALSRRAAGEASALLAYSICIAGFNAIDALRPMHLLLGVLLIITLNARTYEAGDFDRALRRPGRTGLVKTSSSLSSSAKKRLEHA
jgi:hypothetical protein